MAVVVDDMRMRMAKKKSKKDEAIPVDEDDERGAGARTALFEPYINISHHNSH